MFNIEKDIIGFYKLSSNAKTPRKESALNADWDLFPCIENDVIILPGQTVPVGIGCASVIRPDFGFIVECRSGMGVKNNVRIAAQTVDANYRGEIKIAVSNTHANKTMVITNFADHWRQLAEDKIIVIDAKNALAQGYLREVHNYKTLEPATLTSEEFFEKYKDTDRGVNWAGSSDKH